MDNSIAKEIFEKQKITDLLKIDYINDNIGKYKFETQFSIPMVSIKNVKQIMKTQVKLKYKGELITLKYSKIQEITSKPISHIRI